MLLVACHSILRLNLELRIEHLDITPSLTAASAIRKHTKHLLLDVWHFLQILDAKGHEEVVQNFLLDLLRHVLHELLDGALYLLLNLHFLQFVSTRLQALLLILVIGIVFLLLALYKS